MIFKTKRTIPGILIVIFSFICAPFLTGQDVSQIQINTIPLAEGMYMLVGAGGNIGVSSGEEGILLIDSQFGEVSEKIKAALSDLGGGPIKFVLNTNWHYDHVGGKSELQTPAQGQPFHLGHDQLLAVIDSIQNLLAISGEIVVVREPIFINAVHEKLDVSTRYKGLA